MACPLCNNDPQHQAVFENEHARVLIHSDWSPRGHLMIVSSRHVENASDLGESEWIALARVWRVAEQIVLDLTGADRCIVMKLGIQVPHLHIHLYPVSAEATRSDVFAMIDGERREERDEDLARTLRARLTAALR